MPSELTESKIYNVPSLLPLLVNCRYGERITRRRAIRRSRSDGMITAISVMMSARGKSTIITIRSSIMAKDGCTN